VTRTTFSIVKQIVSSISAFFREVWISFDVGYHFAIVLGAFCHQFSILFRHRFLDAFTDAIFSIFDGKWSLKGSGAGIVQSSIWHPFSQLFPHIDFLIHFGRPLAHFWLPFASRWLSLGAFRSQKSTVWYPKANQNQTKNASKTHSQCNLNFS